MAKTSTGNIIDISVPLLLSIPDAEKYFGLSAFAIRKGVTGGKIPHVKSGKKYLICRVALEELIADGGLRL